MNLKTKLIRNGCISGTANFVSIGIHFFLMPFIILRIGALQYGLIEMANLFLLGGYISLFEMGFQSSISKYVAEYAKKNEKKKIDILMSTSLVLFVLIGFFLMVGGLSVSRFLVDHILKIPLQFKNSFYSFLVITSFSYILILPQFAFLGFLEGMQRFDILQGVQIVGTIAYAAATAIVLFLGYDYWAIAVARVVIVILQCYMYFYVIVIQGKSLCFRIASVSWYSLKDIVHMSKFVFIGKLSSYIFFNTPKFLISVFLGPLAMTSYEAVSKIIRGLKIACGFLNTGIIPAASELAVVEKKESLKNLFIKSIRYQLFILYPLIFALLFFSSSLYKIWLGKEYMVLSVPLCIALLWNMLLPFSAIGVTIFLGMNARLNQITFLGVLNTVLNVICTIIFMRMYEVTGIFLGMVLSTAVVLIFYMQIFLKEFNIRGFFYFKEIAVAMGCIAVSWLIGLGLNGIFVKDTWIILGLKVAVFCAVSWGLLYMFFFDQEDKDIVFRLLRGKYFSAQAV